MSGISGSEQTWLGENAVELLHISDERVGEDIVLDGGEDLAAFAANYHRDTTRGSDLGDPDYPPLEFRAVQVGTRHPCGDEQVAARRFWADKSEAAGLLNGGAVRLAPHGFWTEVVEWRISEAEYRQRYDWDR